MTDTLTREERSERMRRVRSKNTGPELKLRRMVHGLGYRYRLHAAGVPGRPDLCFHKRRKAIFVHGCFWHRHDCAAGRRLPKSRVDFWKAKFGANQERDLRIAEELTGLGWKSLIIWECQLKDEGELQSCVREFLDA